MQSGDLQTGGGQEYFFSQMFQWIGIIDLDNMAFSSC
jgi:hypothetical protein